jgi:iron complex outermembrane recepter protein
MHHRIRFTAALAAALLLAPQLHASAPAPADTVKRAAAIHGTVVDAETGQPVGGATVRLRELRRSELSHADGSFHFDRLGAGTFTVTVTRVGYGMAERTVRVGADETAQITFRLQPSAIQLTELVVTGTGTERTSQEAYRPTTVLADAELRRKLATTVAATLAGEPGISQVSNGPAAARPVIRGLGGDRVLMLEDGDRTGDVSSTAPDHAVAVEALTAERIEVVRGPAALLYGSSALAGVVNVIREEVPRTLPERFSGTLSTQGESVNQGLAGGAAVLLPVGSFALRAEASGRRAGDTRTPLGTLPGTDLTGYNLGGGASWIHPRGFVGAAVREYALDYGVPGTFQGETIPGAHEGGADIRMRRTAARVHAGLLRTTGPFRGVDFDANYTRYRHDEIEPGGFIGTQFGQLTATGNLVARHAHTADGFLIEGASGIWGMWKDLAVGGGRSGSHPAKLVSLAGFLYEEVGLGALRLQAGARYDWTQVTPDGNVQSRLENVRQRRFGAISGSLAGLYTPVEGVTLGASVARAFRTPSIEELFSDGPHLASYRFEVGNPDLRPEYGLGTDVFVRATRSRFRGEVTLFRNAIDGYVYFEPTGEMDPVERRVPVVRAQQTNAVLAGAEASVQWEALRHIVLEGNAGYVHARRDGGEPLPLIPPLNGQVGARYDATRYFAGAMYRASSRQTRTADFEEETAGYGLVDLNGGIRWTAWGGRLHTLTLRVDNLLDTAWRDHLSVVKEVAPQPGRNVQLLYRVSF